MRTQFRLLLHGVNAAIAAYSLARLEALMRTPELPEAPLLQRLGSAGSEMSGIDGWASMQRKINALNRYCNALSKRKARPSSDTIRVRLIASARRVIELCRKIEQLHGSRPQRRAR